MSHLVDQLVALLHQVSPPVALLIIACGMMLESMCIPVPSEVILPLAGLWAKEGKFSFAAAMLAVTLGCLLGSSIAYAIGYYGGNPFVERFGRYIFITHHRLAVGEKWLARFGPGAIVLARLTFAVRALISLPVGILRLDYRKFILSTFIGCTLWNLICVGLGYQYGDRFVHVLHQMSIGMFIALAFVALVAGGFYFWKSHVATPGVKHREALTIASGDK